MVVYNIMWLYYLVSHKIKGYNNKIIKYCLLPYITYKYNIIYKKCMHVVSHELIIIIIIVIIPNNN